MTVTVDIDAPATCVAVAPARIDLTPGTAWTGDRGVPAVWGSGHRDQLVIVEAITERALGELRSAVIHRPSDVLNGIGDMEFDCPADDPTLLDCLVDGDTVDLGAGELMLIGREAQWWRDGELRWAGPVVVGEPDFATMTVSFKAFSLAWYLNRRFMGQAERRDLLRGVGSMDRPGLPGWTRVGGLTATRGTSDKVRGTGSAVLTGTGAIQASFTHVAQTSSQDGRVFLTAMVKLPDPTAEDGLIVTIEATPVGSSAPYRPGDYNSAVVDSETPLDGWVRVSARCHMKPNVANTVTVTLWSLSGSSTRFDDVRALRNDTTGINPGEDLTNHAAALINHMQSLGSFGFSWRILSTSGVDEVLGARHLEHAQILDLITNYTERDDGWDWWIDPRDRTIYIASRRGVDYVDLVLDGYTVVAGGWNHDESEKSSRVVVIGDGGDGVDRPEGGSEDTSTTNGLTLDYLQRAPTGTPLSALDPMAAQLLERQSQPQTTFSPIVVPGDWWSVVTPGDRFPTHMRCGVLRPAVPSGGFRVQKVTCNLETDKLELV